MSQERIESLPDVQSSADQRDICIDRVGVKGLAAPLRVRGLDGSEQHTVARLDMYVGLPAHQKGTHMSRFVEVLEASDAPLDYGSARAGHPRRPHRADGDRGARADRRAGGLVRGPQQVPAQCTARGAGP